MSVKFFAPFPVVAIALGLGGVQASPRVAVDIPPVHSLVQGVMGEIGEPDMLLRAGASPHGYAMTPSEARALSQADVVIWTGPALTPWLDRAIGSLAPDTRSVALVDAEGVTLLPFREGALFEAHAHGHEEEGHEGDDHHDAGHEDEHHGDEHAESHDDGDDGHHEAEHEDEHEGGHEDGHEDGHEKGQEDDHAAAHDEDHHDHHAGGMDPHIWLDPANARAMTRAIVAALSAADPGNADTYRANGQDLIEEIAALEAELNRQLEPARGRPFIVFHDAYHYFEARFDIEAAGAISLSDAAAPGPARLSALRERLRALDRVCVFAEPQFPQDRARLVMEGSDARLAVLDPLGATLTPGRAHYFSTLRAMASSMVGCLSD